MKRFTETELKGAELRDAVFALIEREFGVPGLVRFISENFPKTSNYTEDKQAAPEITLEEAVRRIRESRAERERMAG